MTAKQIRDLNDLFTATMVKGYSAEIRITQYHKHKQAPGFIARMVSNIENPAPTHEEFTGKTPLEAYSKMADALVGLL